jgi:hypothetical protein
VLACELLRLPSIAVVLVAPASHPQAPPSMNTHLFPRPQAIVLLELALVVRHTVLAEDPAGGCQYRVGCGKPRGGSGGQRDEERHAPATGAAGRTYPAIVKSGDVSGVVCGCNGWFGACSGRAGRRMMRRRKSSAKTPKPFAAAATFAISSSSSFGSSERL